MNHAIRGVIFVAVVIIIGFVIYFRHQNKKHKKRLAGKRLAHATLLKLARQAAHEVLETTENWSAINEVLVQYRDVLTKDEPGLYSRLIEARAKLEEEMRYRRLSADIVTLQCEISDEVTPASVLAFAKAFDIISREHSGWIKERLLEQVDFQTLDEMRTENHERQRKLYEALCEAAPQNRQAFFQLNALLGGAERELWYAKGHFTPPAQWNIWAMRHWEVPAWNQFRGLNPDVPKGRVSVWAAEALRLDNLLECAIVMAYCTRSADIRREVGDVLYAEVVKAYERLRRQDPLAYYASDQAAEQAAEA